MAKTNVFGLVLCGGKSSRMGTDKSILKYHDKPQCYHIYDMLAPLCAETFISCNSSQASGLEKGYNIIEDADLFKNAGPLTGVLSAFNKFPGSSFVTIGCDYPFLGKEELQRFISSLNSNSIASAFYDNLEQCYQPVLAWYSAAASALLQKNFSEENYSLLHFLKSINADKYDPADRSSMFSIDTSEEREDADRKLMRATKLATV
jgi:molybdopterin-guanine dinucleotide biosynthesis protein A